MFGTYYATALFVSLNPYRRVIRFLSAAVPVRVKVREGFE